MLRAILPLTIFLSPSLSAAPPQDRVPKPIPGVEVTLRFSVSELDPLKPADSFVECIVRNKSDKAIQVPTVYTGGHEGDMSLVARHYWQLALVAWAGPKEQVATLLKPATEMTIFKKELKDIFLLDMTRQKPLMPAERRWYWSWSA
jgi:hypothetical protein